MGLLYVGAPFGSPSRVLRYLTVKNTYRLFGCTEYFRELTYAFGIPTRLEFFRAIPHDVDFAVGRTLGDKRAEISRCGILK